VEAEELRLPGVGREEGRGGASALEEVEVVEEVGEEGRVVESEKGFDSSLGLASVVFSSASSPLSWLWL